MVGVDEHTIQAFGKPQVLWQKELANLIEIIKAGKPSVVALDIVISPATKGLDDEDQFKLRFQDEALELGLTALGETPVLFVEVAADGALSDIEGKDDQVVSPHENILDLLSDENGDNNSIGAANVAQDEDGAIRRMVLYTRQQNVDGSHRPSNIALRMLEAATGERVQFERDSRGEAVIRWRDRTIPILFRDSFLLNFPGPTEDNTLAAHDHSKSESFPIVSAMNVMNGQVPKEFFKDKIVMIAPTASSLMDQKVVPGDRQYHGAALHLTALNMILQDDFIQRSAGLWILVCLMAGTFGFYLGRSGRVFSALATTLTVPTIAFAAFAFANSWLPTVFPLIALSTGGLLGYAERLLTVEKDRARVRSTFARMVSPQVMNHVLANYQSLTNGERKEITVLFSDINDFTPVCEQHTPEEVIKMLSEYFSNMVDVIMKYDGYLKQYVGDEIMVIFGAPDDSSDHATRAVLTALEMRDALAKAKETSQGKPGFYEVKIGINTGSVVLGKVGPESRWEYAAVGDHVNLGARVMSVAKNLGMDIGVSAASKARFEKEREEGQPCSEKVEWISQGVQSFKGKISQMEVFGIKRAE